MFGINEMNDLNLNDKAIREFKAVSGTTDTALDFLAHQVANLKHANGRKVRAERRNAMMQVLEVLYSYLNFDLKSESYGECSPSMRTIARALDPSIEFIYEDDSQSVKKRKDKDMAKVLMYVQRTIHMLKEFGFVKIHEYRAETNQDEERNANFYYEIVPVSELCPRFAKLLHKLTHAAQKVYSIVRNTLDSLSEKWLTKHTSNYRLTDTLLI